MCKCTELKADYFGHRNALTAELMLLSDVLIRIILQLLSFRNALTFKVCPIILLPHVNAYFDAHQKLA